MGTPTSPTPAPDAGDLPRRSDGGVMTTPFNTEAILQACPKLRAEWMKAPFILTYGYDGRVEVKYWAPGDVTPNGCSEERFEGW